MAEDVSVDLSFRRNKFDPRTLHVIFLVEKFAVE
jgi:hypothetical protein